MKSTNDQNFIVLIELNSIILGQIEWNDKGQIIIQWDQKNLKPNNTKLRTKTILKRDNTKF